MNNLTQLTPYMLYINITVDDVYEALISLDINTSAGFDDISPKIL